MPLDDEQTLRAEKAKIAVETVDLQGSLNAAASGPNASTAQNVFRLSDRTGIPADTVSRKLQEISDRMDSRRADAGQIRREAPRTAQYLQNPRNAAVAKDDYEVMQALERHRSGPVSYVKNAARMSGEALNTISGDLLQWVGTLMSAATDTLWQEFQANYEKEGREMPSFNTEGMNPEVQRVLEFVSTALTPGERLQDVGRAISEGGLGSVPNFTWENFTGDMTPKNLLGFLGEQLAVSVPHMAAMVVSLPAYIAATDQRLAEQRMQVAGETGDPSVSQLKDTLPSAILISLIEQYSTKGMLGQLKDQAFKTGGAFAVKELAKSTVREGSQEAVQEAIEYVTERFGLEGVSMSGGELWDRVLPAVVGGAGVGMGFRGVSLGYQAVANKIQGDANTEVNSHIAQIQLDGAIEAIKGNTLMQSSPEDMREFFKSLDSGDLIYFDPDGVQEAIDKGLPVPQHMVDQLGTEQDVGVTLEQFGMDVIASEELTAALHPYMKDRPELLTQTEIQKRDGTNIKEMIQRAHDAKEVFDEAKAIHDEVSSALVETGRLSPYSAKYSAELIPTYVTTKVSELRARGVEITVAEAYDTLGLRIIREGQTAPEGKLLPQLPAVVSTNIIESSEATAEELAYSDVLSLKEEARVFNITIENDFIREVLGGTQADELAGITTASKRFQWIEEHITGEQDLELDRRMANEERLGDFARFVNQFDESSPQAMGSSIALWFKDVDSEKFKESPEYAGIVSALVYARSQGWDINEVLGAATARVKAWAGMDAAELFPRFFQGAAASPKILAQPGDTAQPRGTIELLDDARIIRLSKTSDRSTFLHETGHLFLDAEKQFAAKYGLTDNQEAILKLLEVDSFDDITDGHHETFARTFEDYLRTGNAPSIRLRDAFAAFARWLSIIYTNIKQLGLKLDPEVTQIFDRMLATNIEVEEVLAGAPYKQLFKNKEQAGYSDAEWLVYQKRVEKRNNRTEMNLTEKVLREYRNRRTKEWDEEKRPLIEKEKVRLAGEPVYMMLASLKENKLDSDAVLSILAGKLGGEVPLGRLLGNVVKHGGQDPDALADKYGYATTKEMLEDIRDAKRVPVLLNKAKENAQAQMVRKHGDILNDGTLEQQLHEAAHSTAEEELLLAELRALVKKQRKPKINRKEIAYEAKTLIAEMRYNEIDPNKYYRAEIRAAEKADTSTNPTETLKLKKIQLANHYLYKEATEARRDTAKRIVTIRKAWTRTYNPRKVDRMYINAIKQYAGMYDVKIKPEERRAAARSFYSWLKDQRTGGIQLTLKDQNIIAALDENQVIRPNALLKGFNELTTEEVHSVYEMVTHLRYVGGIEAKEASAEAIRLQGEAVDVIMETGTERARQDEANRLATLGNSISHIFNSLPMLRNLVRNLDGWDEYGWFHKNVWIPIDVEGNTATLRISKKFHNDFKEIMGDMSVLGLASADIGVVTATGRAIGKKLGLSETMGSRESVPRAATPGQPFVLSSTGRFMLAVYWGTESSRKAIRQGHKVTDEEVRQMMGYLTPIQLEAVNNLWKFNATMLKPLFAAGVRRDGVAPEKIPDAPFTVNDVEMTGGHMTLHYTLTQPEIRLDVTSQESGQVTSVTPSKTRALHARTTSGGRTVDLTTHNITKTINENAHEIGFADVARDMQRLLNSPGVKNAIISTRGDGFHKAMMQTIQGVTTNRVEAEMYSIVSHAITTLKRSKVAMHLMLSLRNTMQQFGAFAAIRAEMGGFNWAKSALAFYGTGWQQNKEFVYRKAPQMADRAANGTRESLDMLKVAVHNTKLEKFGAQAARWGFTPQSIVDLGLSLPYWMHKYNEGLMAHGDDVMAASDATSDVNEAIGTGQDIGTGKLMQSSQSAIIKLATIFQSYFISGPFQRAYHHTKGFTDFSNAKAIEAAFITPVITMLISEALVMNIPDIWDEDEEGPDYDGIAVWFISNTARFMSGMVPMMGTVVAALHGFSQGNLIQDLAELPADTIDAMAKTVRGDMGAAEGLEALIRIVGTVKPLYGSGNIVRALDYAQSYAEGREGDTISPYQAVVEGKDRN